MVFSKISLFSLNLKLSCKGKEIGSGTGFFYERNNNFFLVTNYHVLTCRDPKDPSILLDKILSSPDRITFNISVLTGQEFGVASTLELSVDENSVFLEHKKRSHGVDLVALKVNFTPIQREVITTQQDIQLVSDIPIEITSNLFIVGYPWGFSPMDNLPVWKKGTVASEPNIISEDLPKIYVDSFTHPGMSGSPVFASDEREVIMLDEKTHKLKEREEQGEISALEFITQLDPEKLKITRKLKHFRIVGVYSGRVSMGRFDPQIGIVWPIYLVDEMIDDGRIATNPFPPIKIEDQ